MSRIFYNNAEYLVTSGEGGYVEVWKYRVDGDLQPHQLIPTPSQSIWSVTSVGNGDIGVGTNNGNVYIFTADPSRKSDPQLSALYDDQVAAKIAAIEHQKAAERKEVVTIKVALDDGQPNLELRYRKGTDPAEAAQVFLQENNISPIYLDEIVQYIKSNIPEARNYSVFSKPQPPERVVFEGKEWDYVFDVTTDDGRVLKLTYNVGEDTMWAAQRFVEKHNLPIKFLEKVSTLLRTQVPSGQIGSSTSTAPFTDPFTGGGRYVPSSFLNQNGGGNIDPLTGSDRYVPGAELADPKSSNLGPTDPLTGSGAYVSGQAGFMPNSSRIIDKKRPISELVPLRDFFVFGVEQSSTKAVAKLRENNEAQPDEHKLNVEQLRALEEIMSVPNFSAKDIHISAIDRGCLWSLDKIIPVLDAFRLALLNSDMNKIYCSMKSVRGSPPVGPQTLKRLHALLISSATDPVRILVCRALANAAVHSWGQEMLLSDTKTNLSAVVHQIKSKKPAVQLAAASALANWALVLLRHTESGSVTELGPREDALREITEGLRCVDGFSDLTQIAQIRLLQTIATLMWGDATVIKLAKSRDICTIVNRIKDALADEMGKTVARDVVEMTYAV
ncbi:hypothetical protein AB6A40_008015 [Gnathostoma spinigerum]|uniref:Phospholipase A-2-activating protein n=1 Tax=Gnathostoma spinigerum TaxID=75299 RepID=A0ABD6END8_9BILA